jgi:hypothetical protein
MQAQVLCLLAMIPLEEAAKLASGVRSLYLLY